MSDLNHYLIGGYTIGFALLWGYALLLLLEARAVGKAERARERANNEQINL